MFDNEKEKCRECGDEIEEGECVFRLDGKVYCVTCVEEAFEVYHADDGTADWDEETT